MEDFMETKRFKRRSIRLRDYDYAGDGVYFVTVCTYNKNKIFGKIVNGKMFLNKLGEIVRDEWIKTKNIRPYVELDEFVIMPNHFHGIICMENHGAVGAQRAVPLRQFGQKKKKKGTGHSRGTPQNARP